MVWNFYRGVRGAGRSGQVARELIWPAMAAFLLGLLVLQGAWLAERLGITVQIERSGSMISVEYLWGMLAVAALGYVFHRSPAWCAAWFMFGPVALAHIYHFVRFGIPNQWALEVFFIALMTIPYVGIACAMAYQRRRSLKGTG
jgi:hypothetical protein